MTIKIETYKPQWASVEELFFKKYNILDILTTVLNVEIDYENNYNRTPIIKTEFNEYNVQAGILFNYLSEKHRGYQGFSLKYYDQQSNARDYNQSLSAMRTIHNLVTGKFGDKANTLKAIEDIVCLNFPNFDHDRYMSILTTSANTMFWCDYLMTKRSSVEHRLDKLNAWSDEGYSGWREKDPLLCSAYTMLADNLGLRLWAPKNSHESHTELDLDNYHGIHKAIQKLNPHTGCPIGTLVSETVKEETTKMESLNLKEFKSWLEEHTGDDYFVTHSNHSGKLTDDNGLEASVIHVTFQKRTNKVAVDDIAIVNSIKHQKIATQKELDEGSYEYYDDDDSCDDFIFNSGGNEKYSQLELDNHSNQCNPNNDAYHSSRS